LKQKTIRLSSNSLKIIIKILASVLFDKEPNKKTIRLSSNSLKIIIKILASVLFDKEPIFLFS
ncbi:hypothetical protein, partial [Ligilactobacillus salivarius]|uniref:hypothetical protein n=1 Tax=Ligilactobacillus salivarius TaxID=1624 RepID=UPI001CDAF779